MASLGSGSAGARELADALLARFEDPAQGGFFFTSHDHETLLHRPKPAFDNATPSGNGVAAFALQRLGLLLGDARYTRSAERALTFFAGQINQYPSAHPGLLAALEERLAPPAIPLICGPKNALERWRRALAGGYTLRGLMLFLPHGADLPAKLAKPESDTVNAWVCAGVKCLPPLDAPEALAQLVKESGLV